MDRQKPRMTGRKYKSSVRELVKVSKNHNHPATV
jgi:hypothetical protein